MPATVYRKTAAGRAEIGQRGAGLLPATRQLLILVNGSDSVKRLVDKGLPDVRTHLDTLLALQLIEPVPALVAPSPPPAALKPPVASPSAPAPPEDPQRLLALQRRAWQTLQPHFGPDTPTVAQDLLAARSIAQYLASLDAIQAKLAIYMGRKQAERAVDALRR